LVRRIDIIAGTYEGGKAAARTNKRKYGDDYYRKIALKAQEAWDENGRKPRGFAANKELARIAGAAGGRISRRSKREA
jgi:hypothetical protein